LIICWEENTGVNVFETVRKFFFNPVDWFLDCEKHRSGLKEEKRRSGLKEEKTQQ
jgi:hypothetical protein